MNNNVIPKTNEVESKPKSKTKNIIIFTILALLIIVVSVIIYIHLENKKLIDSYENKVYPGTFVFNKDVSGMTKEELHKALE